MIKGHGGNIYDLARLLSCPPDQIIDMSSNINPLGPPPGLPGHLRKHMGVIEVLPEADAADICHAFAEIQGIDPGWVKAGSGTTQFIYALPQVLGSRNAFILGPTYSDYADACRMHGVPFRYGITSEADNFIPNLDAIEHDLATSDLVFICNPNNPTGVLISGEHLLALADAHPNTNFVIDESYLPFVHAGEKHSLLGQRRPNIVVLYSMSKIYRIAGLRLGFLVASEEIQEKFTQFQLPWSVNGPALAAADYILKEGRGLPAFVTESREYLGAERDRVYHGLGTCPDFQPFPSETSFILVKALGGLTAREIFAAVSVHRILLRNCDNFTGLSDAFFRISLKSPEVNARLVELLLELSGQGTVG